MKISNDYRQQDFQVWPRPSELNLARLAAQLARTEKIDVHQLVKEAWALYWESCRMLKEDDRMVEEYFKAIESEDGNQYDYPDEAEAPPVPTPKKYPVSFKEAELLLLPKLKGRTAERAKIMRDFVFVDYVRSKHAGLKTADGMGMMKYNPEDLERLRQESEDECAEVFQYLRSKKFDAREYDAFAHYFLAWYRQRSGHLKSLIRSESARKRWAERRKRHQANTGARPNRTALKEILGSSKKPT